MQVRCPHCSNVFATTETGVQPCPVCATPIDVPAPEAPPTGGFSPPSSGGFGGQHVERENTPWEDRASLGLVQGVVQTWKRSVLKPQEFWPTVRPEGSLGSALGYGWLLSALGVILSIPMMALQMPQLMAQMQEMQAQMGGDAGIFESMGSIGLMVIGVLAMLVLWPVGAIISIAVVHAAALLVGAGNKGFNATARAFFYAQGPNVLSAIPLVGTLASIYSLTLFGWGLKELHGTTSGKAAAAILLPVLVVCCCLCVGLIGMAGAIGTAMGGLPK